MYLVIKEEVPHPICASKKNYEKHVDLLLAPYSKNTHYVLIK